MGEVCAGQRGGPFSGKQEMVLEGLHEEFPTHVWSILTAEQQHMLDCCPPMPALCSTASPQQGPH